MGENLRGRVAYEIARAGDRAMCELHPDLPVLHWTRLDDGTLVGIVGERHVANGTLARWVERLGLVTALSDWDRPGLSRYVGTVDGITIEISGITDRAIWDAARPRQVEAYRTVDCQSRRLAELRAQSADDIYTEEG